jgi:hypothetical protein
VSRASYIAHDASRKQLAAYLDEEIRLCLGLADSTSPDEAMRFHILSHKLLKVRLDLTGQHYPLPVTEK